MKIRLLCFIAAVLFTQTSEFAFAQPTLKRGQEFWVGAFPRIYSDDPTLPQPAKVHSTDDTLRLVIYSDAPTRVEISIPRTGWKRSVFTKDSNAYIVTLPKDSVVAWHPDVPEDKGVHVMADKPITLNCFNLAPNFSDASLILPVEILGNEYIVSCQYIYNPALVQIIATEDGTSVSVEPAVPAWGSARQVTLQRGQIYFMQAQADPTGMRIASDKPIAVFTGVFNQDANPLLVPGFFGNGDGNLTYDQLLPVKEWGKVYYSVPMDASINSGKYPTWTRVVASVNNTVLKINGREVLLNRGQWKDSISNQSLVIQADKPVTVTQMASGIAEPSGNFPAELAGVLGDGTFLQLLGKEKMVSGRSIIFPVPSLKKLNPNVDDDYAGKTYLDFLTVIAPTAERGAVYLDGKSLASEFRAFQFDTAMSYAYIQVTKGKHELWSTGKYHVYSYGWGYSEAYSTSTGIKVGARKPAMSFVSACIGVPIELQGYAEAGAIRWMWDFADGTAEITTSSSGLSPDGDEITRVNHTFLKAGKYPVRLRILYNWSNGVEDTVFRTVSVNELPKPTLTVTDTVLCFGESVKLFASTGFVTYAWQYEGSPVQPNSATPNELSVSRAGVYSVFVTNENGCIGSTSIPITVLPEITFSIKGAKEACLNAVENYSVILPTEGKNFLYAWGTPGGTILSGAGTPDIRIQWTAEGKQSITFQIIDLQTNCSKDTIITVMVGTALSVNITGKKVICAGAETELFAESVVNENLTYQWLYNGQILKNETAGKIKAVKAGTYTVNITSISGCKGQAMVEVMVASTPEIPQISGKSSLCNTNDTLLLTLGTPEKYSRKQWFFDGAEIPGDTLGSINVVKPGKYRIVVYNTAGCEETAEVTIAQFSIALSKDTTICIDNSVQLFATTAAGFSNTTYNWSPADGLSNATIPNPVATPLKTTTYRLVATNQDGLCTIADSVQVRVVPALILTTQDVTLCKGETTQLALNVESVPEQKIVKYSWNPSIGVSDPAIAQPLVTATATQLYTVTVTNESGCSVSQTVTVFVKEKENIRAEIVGQKRHVEPGENSSITFQLWSRFKELDSFKVRITYDKSVFQYVHNSAAFLLGTVGNWQIQAEEKEPGELTISAGGTTPLKNTILGFNLAAFLGEQSFKNVTLHLDEINGAPVETDNICMEIDVKSDSLQLDDICAGELRLIKLGNAQTQLQSISPNPSTGSSLKIQYSVGIAGEASVEIYDHKGILVSTLARGFHEAGERHVLVNTGELPSGVYLCKFTTPQIVQTQVLSIVK